MPGPFDESNLPGGTLESLPEPLPPDPFPIFVNWFNEAHARRVAPNPNAFTLATVNEQGFPAARILLCKSVEPGAIVFYTNYAGRKGRELDATRRAAATFHWDTLDRQVRIEGQVLRTSPAESDAYFASRPWESRIGAWASDQSQPIASRHDMLARVRAAMERFGLDPARPPAPEIKIDIPRPPHWGGYRLVASRVELWLSGIGRVHDRAAWTRTLSGDTLQPGPWSATRLQP